MLINLRHLKGAFNYSLQGLRRAWQNEQAFRHEILIFPVMFIVIGLIRPGFAWAGALVASWLVVMAFELVNSAIEEAFNLISPEYNIHVKYGKDMASAAIFAAICGNVALWVCMFLDVYAF